MGYQYKFDIAGTEYGMNDVRSVKQVSPLFDKFSVGNVCSAELDITFWQKSEIPKMAQIIPHIQLEDGTWYQLGEFYTDTRAKKGNALNIVAYDPMMKGEEVWEPAQDLEFPMTMPKAVAVIAALMGLEIDSRTVLNDAYTIDYPANDQTLRETLGYIAGAHAGNWIITNAGKLYLVPLFDSAVTHTVGERVATFEQYTEIGPITAVSLFVDDENEIVVGDTTGYTLEIDCPYGTEAMAANILAALSGKIYNGFRATGAILNPAAELGDAVIVNGVESFIAYRSVNYGPGHMSEIAAPGESTLVHEYKYKSPSQRETDRKIAENRALLIKNNEEIRAEVSAIDGRLTKVQQTAGQVSVESTDEKGTLTTLIDSDSWKAWFVDADGVEKSGLHFDFEKGRFVFNGTGQFGGINEGDTYIAIDGQDVCVYDTGGNVVMRLGVKIMPTEAAFQFPYIGMTTRWWSEGSLAKEDTLIIRNPHGMWIGNGHIAFYEPEDSSDYEHLQDFGVWVNDSTAGIFISGWASHVWLVSGKVCTELYTGDTIARFG